MFWESVSLIRHDETRFEESGLFVRKESKKDAAFEAGRRTTGVKGKVRYLRHSVSGTRR